MHKRQNLTKCWWTVNSTTYLTLALCCCCNRNAVCADAISSSSSSSSSPSSTREHILWRLSHLLQRVVLWYCQISLQLPCCFCLLFHFLPLSSWHWPFFSGMLVEILDSHHIHFSMWPLHIHASGSTQEDGWGRKIKHPMKDSPALHRSGRPFLLEHLALVRREEGKESPWWLLVTGNRAFYNPPPRHTHHIAGQTTTTVVQGGDYLVQGTTTKTRPPCTRPLPVTSNSWHPPGLSVPAQTKRKEDLFSFLLPRQSSKPPQPPNH